LTDADITHDLQVAEAYLHLWRSDPAAATAWVGEDTRGKAGKGLKDPDAFLVYEDGRSVAVEFLGQSYTDNTIRAFHEHCHRFSLPYQLW